MSFTDVKIKIPGPGDVNDVMQRKRARRILGDFEESQLVENQTPNGKGRLSGLAEARRICALRVPHVIGVQM